MSGFRHDCHGTALCSRVEEAVSGSGRSAVEYRRCAADLNSGYNTTVGVGTTCSKLTSKPTPAKSCSRVAIVFIRAACAVADYWGCGRRASMLQRAITSPIASSYPPSFIIAYDEPLPRTRSAPICNTALTSHNSSNLPADESGGWNTVSESGSTTTRGWCRIAIPERVARGS